LDLTVLVYSFESIATSFTAWPECRKSEKGVSTSLKKVFTTEAQVVKTCGLSRAFVSPLKRAFGSVADVYPALKDGAMQGR
jgi:hypothetical protein